MRASRARRDSAPAALTRRIDPIESGALPGYRGESVQLTFRDIATALMPSLRMLGLGDVTIAISVKVNDGVVLAADSATSLIGRDPTSPNSANVVVNIYNNANKIFNLLKRAPIGAITWGSGSVGVDSISSLIKDLRRRFSGDDPAHVDWKIDRNNYSVLSVAVRLRQFVFDETYTPRFADWPEKPSLGFIVAGYGTGSATAEEYQINIENGECGPPALLRSPNEAGVTWSGQPEAITRLVMGFGVAMPQILQERLGVPAEQIPQVMGIVTPLLQAPLVMPAMPIQDAIDVARFLVDTTIKFYRYLPGAPTVGGPIEIAAITKHEGFKWVARKHYYSQELNVGAER